MKNLLKLLTFIPFLVHQNGSAYRFFLRPSGKQMATVVMGYEYCELYSEKKDLDFKTIYEVHIFHDGEKGEEQTDIAVEIEKMMKHLGIEAHYKQNIKDYNKL